MIPEQTGRLPVLVLIVLPLAVAGLLRLGFRSRGRVEGGRRERCMAQYGADAAPTRGFRALRTRVDPA